MRGLKEERRGATETVTAGRRTPLEKLDERAADAEVSSAFGFAWPRKYCLDAVPLGGPVGAASQAVTQIRIFLPEGAWRKRHRRCRHNLCSLGRLSDVRVHRRVSVPCRDARLALQGYDDAQECAPNRCPLFLSSPFDKAREISLFPTWACNDFVEDGIRVVGNAASTSPLFARRFPFFPLA